MIIFASQNKLISQETRFLNFYQMGRNHSGIYFEVVVYRKCSGESDFVTKYFKVTPRIFNSKNL